MKRIAFFAPLFLVALPAMAVEPTPPPAENSPPKFGSDYEDVRRIKAGEMVDITLDAQDPDNDPISFTCRGLPPGARARAVGKTSLVIVWRTQKSDHGTFEVECDASDGKAVSTKYLRLEIQDDWQSYFMPGASFSMLQPVDKAAWGTFTGVSTEILVASWIHRNENRGPSHGRVYLDMDILRSTRSGTASAFDLAMGFDLSLERNPSRHWLLPFFGMKTGAFIQKDLDEGKSSVWHLTPLAGAYLWADKNLFITASAGYMLPVSAARFDDLRGLRANVGLNFSLW